MDAHPGSPDPAGGRPRDSLGGSRKGADVVTSVVARRLVGVLAAVALALGVTAGLAQPASAGVWDRVAKCESGGNWKINTGNGHYGGLQFSRSTWNSHGGRTYAKTANKASKREQIAIARRVLATQGPRAWACAGRAHLTRSNGKANRHATAGSSSGAEQAGHAKHTKKIKKIIAKKGTTLAAIAHRYHVKGGWKKVYRLNKAKLTRSGVGKHAHRSFPHGMKLRIRR